MILDPNARIDTKGLKVIAFDLDGTLTQHRSPLGEQNRALLDRLARSYRLIMVGAGRCMRIFEQMGGYPIDIIGNYGLQYARYDAGEGALKLVRDTVLPCDRERVEKNIDMLRKKYGFTEFAGEGIEFHPSGAVTFPLLGKSARIEDKLAFDPDRSRRRPMYAEVKRLFPEYTVFIGGSSSFDLVPTPYDKYYALSSFCAEEGYLHNELLYVGDDYGDGGNDEAVAISDFPFVCVDDYNELPRILSFLY